MTSRNRVLCFGVYNLFLVFKRPDDHRRKWNVEEFEEKSQKRKADEDDEDDEGEHGHSSKHKDAPPVKRELLKARDYKVGILDLRLWTV